MSFGIILIMICPIISIIISNLLFYKKLKNNNLSLLKIKIIYLISSIVNLFGVVCLIQIYIARTLDFLIPNTGNLNRQILFESFFLFFVLFFYFFFQYLINRFIFKKIIKKYSINDFEEIGLNVND